MCVESGFRRQSCFFSWLGHEDCATNVQHRACIFARQKQSLADAPDRPPIRPSPVGQSSQLELIVGLFVRAAVQRGEIASPLRSVTQQNSDRGPDEIPRTLGRRQLQFTNLLQGKPDIIAEDDQFEDRREQVVTIAEFVHSLTVDFTGNDRTLLFGTMKEVRPPPPLDPLEGD